ncbi:type VI secretion protein [Altererythrobacter salegens]|uniref:Type VI secretion protein n=1 Tax=Croceibacterium salegens TaxID=1737568 RepID=A0A6I4SYX0_9SPHN|nr:TrbG/VirB9 family P-type conjugative transfer protein [Croceibacterium salegens]MXO59986.1 type VI secretion protein [Croceibacterium salegens]
MSRILLGATLLAICVAASARAQDTRLANKLYDPAQVVLIEGKVNIQATIRFDKNETIENVAIGDSRAWQVTPNKRANLLFVKPMAERATTNMTVITDKRTYYFDLVANPNAKPIYALDFEFPNNAVDESKQVADTARQPNSVEFAAANDPYAVVNPNTLNFEWRAQGDKDVLPDRVYDDGEATFLIWRTGQPLPAILLKNDEGAEGPVNFAVRGDVIVIAGVPREIVLRSGRHSAKLSNEESGRQLVRSGPAALARINASEIKQ